MIPDGGGDGFLQRECGQGRDFRRQIIIRGAVAADGGNGKDQVAQLVSLFQTTAFWEQQDLLGLDRGVESHNGR